MKHRWATLWLFLFMIPGIVLAQEETSQVMDDSEAVRQAVLDYVEGIYHVQPERIERSVHPSLAKYGYWLPKPGEAYRGMGMNFEQLVKLAATWNAKGQLKEEGMRKDIEILDLMDKTASVKLSASWGVDYMHLAKEDGKWLIMHVMWQSYPAADHANH